MTTPASRLARLLTEGARFTVQLPDQTGLDVTPDVVATLEGLAGEPAGKESIPPIDSRRDVPTGVQFP